MSKIIYVCARNSLPDSIERRLHEICKNLAPDNIVSSEPTISVSGKNAYGIMNPVNSILEQNNSVLMGQLFENNVNWGDTDQDLLDGSYAIFRDGKNHFEIVSDPVASRTIWYYMDEEMFVSSTSQRAIIMLIGNFEFDDRIIPWVLSTGTLGPLHSWDKRTERVPPDSSVILNKKDWSISQKSIPIKFTLVERSKKHHQQLLSKSLEDTFDSLDLDLSNWILPLSGGYDSRGILCLLRNTINDINRIKTITWGTESSLHEKKNDACVAKKLADTLNVSHKYYYTDVSDEPIDEIINRFILLGEGRIDHLSGYMDGFEIWKTLFEEGVQGVIRGDEGFGWIEVSSPLAVRHSVGCTLCSDFSNLKNYRVYGFATQELPENLSQKKDETLAGWRDRIYHEFRLPTMLSSLSDLKLSYVEVINPLLSRKALQQVRQLPDHLRTRKTLFKKIVISLCPKVDFASKSAPELPQHILRQRRITSLIKKELATESAKAIFPTNFIDNVLQGIETEQPTEANKLGWSLLQAALKRILPRFTKNAIRNWMPSPSVDSHVLAFRAFLISRMNAILNDDTSRLL
jgi:hypothetical protein